MAQVSPEEAEIIIKKLPAIIGEKPTHIKVKVLEWQLRGRDYYNIIDRIRIENLPPRKDGGKFTWEISEEDLAFLRQQAQKWLPFEQAREWARNSGIKTMREWFKHSKDGKLPKGIPSNPAQVYSVKWKGWPDWLNNGQKSKSKDWLPFEQAREWARNSGIQTGKQWGRLGKEGKLPKGIPSDPAQVYSVKWKGWPDWLNNGQKSKRRNVKWRSSQQAREWARNSGIQTGEQWGRLSKEGNLPKDIPSNPSLIYKDDWKGWPDFLGKV